LDPQPLSSPSQSPPRSLESHQFGAHRLLRSDLLLPHTNLPSPNSTALALSQRRVFWAESDAALNSRNHPLSLVRPLNRIVNGSLGTAIPRLPASPLSPCAHGHLHTCWTLRVGESDISVACRAPRLSCAHGSWLLLNRTKSHLAPVHGPAALGTADGHRVSSAPSV
jgi:hypothetical protein